MGDEETQSTSLKDEVKKTNDLLAKLVESGKLKDVKLKNVPSKSKVKKGYAYVVYVRENGEWDPKQVLIEDGTGAIEGLAHIMTPEYRMSYNGCPAYFVPAWNTEPFSPMANFEQATRDKTLAVGQRLVINRLEQGKIEEKKKMSGGLIFAIVIAIIVGGYLLLT